MAYDSISERIGNEDNPQSNTEYEYFEIDEMKRIWDDCLVDRIDQRSNRIISTW